MPTGGAGGLGEASTPQLDCARRAPAERSELIADARRIKAVIGC